MGYQDPDAQMLLQRKVLHKASCPQPDVSKKLQFQKVRQFSISIYVSDLHDHVKTEMIA